MLRLIERMLKAGVLSEGQRLPTEQGTPQGGIVSPLLSNILLTPFDCEMRRRGFRLTRYADDWVVTCHTRAEACRVLAEATQILKSAGRDAQRREDADRPRRDRLRVPGVQDQAREPAPEVGPGQDPYRPPSWGPLRVPAGEVDRALQGPDPSADPAEVPGQHPGTDPPNSTRSSAGGASISARPTSASSSPGLTVGSCDASGRNDSRDGAVGAGNGCRSVNCTASWDLCA